MTNEQARRLDTLLELGYIVKWSFPPVKCAQIKTTHYIDKVTEEQGIFFLHSTRIYRDNEFSHLDDKCKVEASLIGIDWMTFYKEVPSEIIFDKFNPDSTE